MQTKIEWVRNDDGTQGYSINPVKGKCPMACSYCYARRLYDRFRWNPEIRLDLNTLMQFLLFPSDSKVFVGSTIELFGEWVKSEWMQTIFDHAKERPDVTFIFLTKRPKNLAKWSPFPKNCYVGVSVTTNAVFCDALYSLRDIKAGVKFISFEPLLEEIPMPCVIGNPLEVCDWIICGQQTPVSVKTAPKLEWIKEIVEAADKARIPIFLKNNLSTMEFG